MAKLGKRNIKVHNPVDWNQSISVDIDVMVSKDGEFYFTVSQDDIDMLENYGVDFSNSYNKRTHKKGTFYGSELNKLVNDFKQMLEVAVSGETLVDEYVILYFINTGCTYYLANNQIFPNGTYTKEEGKWIDGDKKMSSDSRSSFGFNVYAQIYRKQVIRFHNGKEKKFYFRVSFEQKQKNLGEYGRMLNDFSLQAFDIKDADRGPIGWNMGDKKEMAYTEENAKFFYNLLIAICKINEQVKNFVNEPELLQEIIHKQVKLLN